MTFGVMQWTISLCCIRCYTRQKSNQTVNSSEIPVAVLQHYQVSAVLSVPESTWWGLQKGHSSLLLAVTQVQGPKVFGTPAGGSSSLETCFLRTLPPLAVGEGTLRRSVSIQSRKESNKQLSTCSFCPQVRWICELWEREGEEVRHASSSNQLELDLSQLDSYSLSNRNNAQLFALRVNRTGTKPQLYVCVLVNLLALTLLAVHVLVSVWLVPLIKDKEGWAGSDRQT